MLAQISFQGIMDSLENYWTAIWQYFSNGWVLTALALIVVLLIVLYFISKKQPSRIRAFNNDNGYVEISRPALVDIIRSTSEQVDIEKKPGVSIRTKRGRLHVDVRIKLLPSRRLTEVSDVLQKHLIETLEEGLGIRKLGKINVVVIGVRMKSDSNMRLGLPLNRNTAKEEEASDSVEVVDSVYESDPQRSTSSTKSESDMPEQADFADSKNENNGDSDESSKKF